VALVTLEDLEKYMDMKFSVTQAEGAQFTLDGLHEELEAFLRRPIEVTTFVEDYRVEHWVNMIPPGSSFRDYHVGDGYSIVEIASLPYTVYVRNSPVVSVTSVVVTTPSGTETTLTEGTEYVVRRYGVDVYQVNGDDLVTITYTAGLDGTTIPMFKNLILRASVRELQNLADDVIGVKDLTARDVAPLVTGFTEEELRSVRRWRRVRVA
jgi:hypothetical protein